MKKFLTLLVAVIIVATVSQTSFAQKKKDKGKKSKISAHGEKNNDGIYNQRKNTVNEGTAGKSKKKKSKKSKRDASLLQSPDFNQFYVYYRKHEEATGLRCS